MSGIEERMAEVLRVHPLIEFDSGGGWKCRCVASGRDSISAHRTHVAAVLVGELNPIVITAAASAIRAYIASKIEALSYHGDESAIAALKQMAIVADDIVRYGLDVDPPGRNDMKDGEKMTQLYGIDRREMSQIEERLAAALRRHMYESVHDADFPDGLDEPSLGFQRDPDVKKWSEMVAKAVIAELGLTQEWCCVTDGTRGHTVRTLDDAQGQLRTAQHNNASYERTTGRIPDFAQNPHMLSRYATAWAAL